MAFENPSGRYYNPESLREPAFRCGIHSFCECSLAVRVDAGGRGLEAYGWPVPHPTPSLKQEGGSP